MSLWLLLATLLGSARAQDFHALYVGAGLHGTVPLDDFGDDASRAGLAPHLELSDVLLWGHAQAYMSVSPWGLGLAPLSVSGDDVQQLRSQAGLRFHLGPSLVEKPTTFWLGVGVVDYSYRLQGGPSRSQLRMVHGAGVTRVSGPWLATLSGGFVPFTSTRYPDTRDDQATFGVPSYAGWPLVVSLSVSRSAGTIYAPAPRSSRPRVEPWVGLGGGAVALFGDTDDRLMQDEFAGNNARNGWFPQLDAGLKLPRGHGVLLSYRHLQLAQDAYGLNRLWIRESLVLAWEWTPFSAVGLEPFVSVGASGDYLRFVQRDFEVVTAASDGWRVWPSGTLGVGFRPAEQGWLRLRTQARASPGLALDRSGPVRTPWTQAEWTVLSVEVYPRRW